MHRLKHALHRLLRPARYRHLAELLHTQSLSRAAVLQKQQQDLADIVAHAVRNTAYYAERFAPLLQGERPIAARVGSLPILTKDDIRPRLDDLLSRTADRRQVRLGHTGGSTGSPLAFWYDEAKHELMRAGMCRSYMMSGWRPGEKILNFWGARQDTQIGGVFGAGWGDFVAAERTIAAHAFSEAQMHGWADTVRRYRPVLLQGYASVLAAFARFVSATGEQMPDSIRGVYSTAEVLGDAQRQAMEQAFGCKVYNQYGSREIPNIACECRHGKMHVFTDMVYLESLDGMAGGEAGQLVVTSLTNRLMPLIRYAIGDTGQLLDGACRCGSPFPLMAMGLCRQNDHIRTPGGKRIHPAYFSSLLAPLPQIREYQFIQTAPDRLTLNVVVAEPLTQEQVASINARIAGDLDAAMVFELNPVAEIGRTASGKHRYVISHC